MKSAERDSMKRLYSIEWLRIWFTALIILCHTAYYNLITNFFHGHSVLSGSTYTDVFFLISGFFIFISLQNAKDESIIQVIKHRCLRLLPALWLYKILCVILLSYKFKYLPTDLIMFNKNVGIDVQTNTHIIWFVDVLFWVNIFYITLYFSCKNKIHFFFLTTLIMYFSLVILFSHDNINFHFQMATIYLDGGVLRGLAFVGLGIIVASLPKCPTLSSPPLTHTTKKRYV